MDNGYLCSRGRVTSTSLVYGIRCMDISVDVILQPRQAFMECGIPCMDNSVYVILKPRQAWYAGFPAWIYLFLASYSLDKSGMRECLYKSLCLRALAAATSLVCGSACMAISVYGLLPPRQAWYAGFPAWPSLFTGSCRRDKPGMRECLHGYLCLRAPAAATSLVCGNAC
jgi:hypothetical protein